MIDKWLFRRPELFEAIKNDMAINNDLLARSFANHLVDNEYLFMLRLHVSIISQSIINNMNWSFYNTVCRSCY